MSTTTSPSGIQFIVPSTTFREKSNTELSPIIFNPPVSPPVNIRIQPAVIDRTLSSTSTTSSTDKRSVLVLVGGTVSVLITATALRKALPDETRYRITVYWVEPDPTTADKRRLISLDESTFRSLLEMGIRFDDNFLSKCCFSPNPTQQLGIACDVPTLEILQKPWINSYVLVIPEQDWLQDIRSRFSNTDLKINYHSNGSTYATVDAINRFIQLANSYPTPEGMVRFHILFTDFLQATQSVRSRLFGVTNPVIKVASRDAQTVYHMSWTIPYSLGLSPMNTLQRMMENNQKRVRMQATRENAQIHMQVLLSKQEFEALQNEFYPAITSNSFVILSQQVSADRFQQLIGFSMDDIHQFMGVQPSSEKEIEWSGDIVVTQEVVGAVSPIAVITNHVGVYLMAESLVSDHHVLATNGYVGKLMESIQTLSMMFGQHQGMLSPNDLITLVQIKTDEQAALLRLLNQAMIRQGWTDACLTMMQPLSDGVDRQRFFNVLGVPNDTTTEGFCRVANPAFQSFLSSSGSTPDFWTQISPEYDKGKPQQPSSSLLGYLNQWSPTTVPLLPPRPSPPPPPSSSSFLPPPPAQTVPSPPPSLFKPTPTTTMTTRRPVRPAAHNN